MKRGVALLRGFYLERFPHCVSMFLKEEVCVKEEEKRRGGVVWWL